MRIWISALFLAMAVAGCGSSPPPDKDQPPTPTVFDDTVHTIDKAKGAEAQIESRVDDLNRQLEPQENGDAAPQEKK
jgi:PBP1b-binding outer membrane lipoprotein LpoB